MNRNLQKIVVGAVLFALLALGALFGSAVGVPILGLHASVPVARADDCDSHPPPPGVDCPPTPTPTPTPDGN